MSKFSPPLKIITNKPVRFENSGFPLSIKTNLNNEVDYTKYKIAVFQRNLKSKPNETQLQFEKPILKLKNKIYGNIWYGSLTDGNLDKFQISVLVLPENIQLNKYPVFYDLSAFNYILREDLILTRRD